MNIDTPSTKILTYSEKAPAPPCTPKTQAESRVLYSQTKSHSVKKAHRFIPQTAEKVLDAPNLVDDYYLNLMDWSCQNQLAVALQESVYLWNANSGSIELLASFPEGTTVCSVSFIEDGSYIAIGTSTNDVQLWNIERKCAVKTCRGHTDRVGALAWHSYILSSGSRDTTIMHHDVRVPDNYTAILRGHSQEVCGLKWSPCGSLLASGGNDNLLNIWEPNSTAPKFTLAQHNAAVRALAWCPWQTTVLASGGGSADRQLRIWNAATGVCLNNVDTESQVCSVLWSKHDKELITSHGFSRNQLSVWKYPTLTKIADLEGHTARVLHMAQSPDNTTIVSAAGDETLRFWRVFTSDADAEAANRRVVANKQVFSTSKSAAPTNTNRYNPMSSGSNTNNNSSSAAASKARMKMR